jgi:alpha-galactosidase
MGVKIAIIGAGSGMFSLSLISDICLTKNLADSTLHLMDIDQSRLEHAHKLCTRYASEVGIKLNIQKTLDRREALKGADFVINTALAPGPGWSRLREGWKVAKRLGYRFGGSLHIIHDEAFWINFYQFRLMEAIVQDILEICPKAWYVMVANPVLAGTTLLTRKYPQANIVGMCHGYSFIYYVAEKLGLERDQIEYEIPGVNHFVWLTQFAYKGKDAYPLLQEWVEKKSSAYFKKCHICDWMGPKAVDLYKRFGVFPIGDTAIPGGGTWGYWYHKNWMTELRWKESPAVWFGWYFWYVRRNAARIAKIADNLSVKVTEAYPETQADEPMVPLIEALACNVERTVVVNVANSGDFVEGVPKDFEVEIPATVNSKGIFGKKTTKLPDAVIRFLQRDRIVPVELELKAYETGSRDYLRDLILTDPWTRSGKQADKLIQGILDLPYHEEMRKHYR